MRICQEQRLGSSRAEYLFFSRPPEGISTDKIQNVKKRVDSP
jgi:hypothetical protein